MTTWTLRNACWIMLAAATLLLPAAATQAAPLTLTSGSIFIDTDSLQMTGAATANGTDEGGVAVFNFSSISLTGSTNVLLTGSRPLSLRSFGDITVGIVLNASGGNGQIHSDGSQGGVGVLGGGDGGIGGFGATASPGTQGIGPGGGGGQTSCCGGGSGGGFGGIGGLPNTDTNAALPAGAAYGDELLSVLQGGSGGGGGAGTNACCHTEGGGGGAGGGALELLSQFGSITVTSLGAIVVNGGDGAGSGGTPRNGGGGSGGAIRLDAGNSISIEGLLSADGGISHLTSIRGGGGGGGGRIALFSPELYVDELLASPGFLSSDSFLSVLGGLGSSDPAGGNPGLPGTIFFSEIEARMQIIPEPSALLLLGLGVVALGGGRMRRRARR